jgi:aldose 1-epimerase
VALGGTPVGSVVLTVPASDEVLVDERKLPTGTTQVRPEVDFRSPRAVGSTRLDTAYTGLGRDADGRWAVRLSGLGPADAPRTVTVWGDEALRWVQVFTPPLDDPHFAGLPGIAVEPMSCPADAFNSGDGLVVLEPGQAWSASWGISSAAG